MKNKHRLLIAITIGIVLAGCGTSARMISKMGEGERSDVFTELTSEGPVPDGFADVVIKASLKTPLEGYYPLESKKSAHGKQEYTFLVNIDGQAVLWKVEGRKLELPKYIDGKTSHDPEAGEGMKYVLERKVRLAAGVHKVFFGLPGEAYYTIVEIIVKSDSAYVLNFKPHYWFKTVPTRIPTFLKGIDNYDVEFSSH